MDKKKEKIVTVVALVALLLVTVGISYAAFTYIGQGQRENTIQTGNLTFVYDELNKLGNGISIDNATPTADDEGRVSLKIGEVFEFSVTASTKGAPIYYEIYTAKQDDSTLPERVVKTYLTELEGTIETEVVNQLTSEAINLYSKLGISQVPNQTGGRTLYQEMVPEGQEGYAKTFRYRMWIREDATDANERGVWKYSNKAFTVRVNVYASNEAIPEAIKPEQEPNEPVLVKGQIPVIYDKEKSSWVKADTGTNWYDYSKQEWANVVTVKATGTKTREEYMSAESGTPVSMDDINTMWVWIPRYEYMYTNLGEQYAGGTAEQPGEIKIKFLEGKNITASDTTNYKVHPAFTFGTDELEGFWYGKFETTGTLPSNGQYCRNANCNVETVTVKPGAVALTNQTVSSLFNVARSMQMNNAATYGFSTTDSDVHMSKNSEWGSVAYISQSKYGKYGNPNYEGANKEVYQNKSNYIAGSSNGTPGTNVTNTQNSYDKEGSGTGASTTGNLTGIYDMSGGATEYVMGNYNSVIGSSGFSVLPDVKYYDSYTTTTATTACNGEICYGHALSETGGWYSDNANFIDTNNYWIVRGGGWYSSTNAGIFYNDGYDGAAHSDGTLRLTQVPLK